VSSLRAEIFFYQSRERGGGKRPSNERDSSNELVFDDRENRAILYLKGTKVGNGSSDQKREREGGGGFGGFLFQGAFN